MFSAVMVVFACVLWLNGRYRQMRWQPQTSTVTFRPGGKGVRPGMAIVIFTGAFNGPPHTERIAQELRRLGDVYVVNYPKLLCDGREAAETAYRAIIHHDLDCFDEESVARGADNPVGKEYSSVAILGLSMGFVPTMILSRMLLGLGDRFYGAIYALGDDPAFKPEHILIPGTAKPAPAGLTRWLTMHVRPGPFWNWAFSFILPFVFREVPKAERSDDVDEDQLDRHMAALRDTRLSLFLSQTGVIAHAPTFEPLDGVWGGLIQCGERDVVIDAAASAADMRELFPRLPIVTAEGSGHVQLVEHPEVGLLAIVQLIEELLVRSEEAEESN